MTVNKVENGNESQRIINDGSRAGLIRLLKRGHMAEAVLLRKDEKFDAQKVKNLQ